MPRTLDILLINPGGNLKANYQGLANKFTASEPPVWCGLIATFLRRKGIEVVVLDAKALGYGAKETAAAVEEYAPLLTAVVAYGQHPSASTQVMPGASAACSAIKEQLPDAFVTLVGGHVAALPQQTLEKEDVDCVCDGEGPYALLELCKALRSGERNLLKVRGIVFKKNGQTVQTPPAPNVTALDEEMPGLAWDLLPMDRYIAHNWHCFGERSRKPYSSLYTSLGCPFRCDFCCIQTPFKRGETALKIGPTTNTYRMWRPETVLTQIDTLVTKYGVRHIKFADELFVCNKRHVMGICDGIIERGYNLNIWCYTRVDSWDAEMLDRMKAAGINWVCPGIESGNARVRDDVHKGYAEDNIALAIGAFKKAGLRIMGNYIFGLPEDDMASMRDTLELALRLQCEFANFYCVMAYPGSRLWDRAVAEGLPLPANWNGFAQHAYDALPLPTRHLRGEDVLRFRDDAFHEYFSNPDYLAMMGREFGAGVMAEIKEMTTYRLPRRYLEKVMENGGA